MRPFAGMFYHRDRTQVVTTITSGSTWSVPTWTNSVDVECWGAGGPGATTSGTSAGGGGGGGAYVKKSAITVTPGSTVSLQLASAPSPGTNPADTWFYDSLTVKAASGKAASTYAEGAGGTTANSIGDTKYAGGNGGTASSSSLGRGGGGGGGAATGSSAGTSAADSTTSPYAPTAGGNAGTNGGAGGAAATSGSASVAGTDDADGGGGGGGGYQSGTEAYRFGAAGGAPGGGGGGTGHITGQTHQGGNGSRGQIRITYTPV